MVRFIFQKRKFILRVTEHKAALRREFHVILFFIQTCGFHTFFILSFMYSEEKNSRHCYFFMFVKTVFYRSIVIFCLWNANIEIKYNQFLMIRFLEFCLKSDGKRTKCLKNSFSVTVLF